MKTYSIFFVASPAIKQSLLTFLLILTLFPIQAQKPAVQVKEDDLTKELRESLIKGSNPFSLTNVNGTLYFRADDATNGFELWKSDGITGGTVLVKDILTGSSGSDPRDLTNFNGTLYFTADDGIHGPELWKSDGTREGTILVKDINPGN
ncbi:MAG: hypothetical protein LH606_04790 [Cytophagaceae bacterium]|nr:hypothetical protein [Cytophagaceae bacterium]